MKYIPSTMLKEKSLPYHGIEEMRPWMVTDGSFAALLKKYCAQEPHGKMFDLGCGGGEAFRPAAAYFKTFYGADIVNYLSAEWRAKVTFSKVDLNFEHLPLPDNSVNLVTAFQVIEHLENPFFIMREVKRVLKPGGLFIFSVPNPYNLAFKLKFFFTNNMPPWTKDNNHLLFLTKAVLQKTFFTEFSLCEVIYQKGAVPGWGRLRALFGRGIPKHLMVLPRTEYFARRVGYCLKKEAPRQHAEV